MTFGSYKSAAAVAVVETEIADAGVVVVVGAVAAVAGSGRVRCPFLLFFEKTNFLRNEGVIIEMGDFFFTTS